MKATAVLALVGAALASAQATTRSAPFFLKYKTCPNSAETYFLSCHSGAGQAGLCPEGSPEGHSAPRAHQEYFLNETTQSFENHPLGLLTWNLPIGNGNPVPSALNLQLQLVSNSAIPIFSPGDMGIYSFGFDDDEKLFLFSRQDDSKAEANKVNYVEEAYYRWHVCWTYVGNYYYQSLVWVTAGEPVNP